MFVDYYEVLGVWASADEASVKKAYFKLAKIYHPDVAGRSDTPEGEIDFKLINEAFAVLSDPLRRREFDEQLKKSKRSGGSEQREADKRSAHLAFDQARQAIRMSRYDKAAVLLKSAIQYDNGNAAYHSLYGFSLGVLKTNLHEARDACKRALEIEFYNPDYHANLGYVYHQAGLTATADESFEEALKWDPEHTLANKYHSGSKGRKQDGGMGLGGLFSFFRKGDKKKDKETNGRAKRRLPKKRIA